MNILFITYLPITNQRGGIERISDIIISHFPSKYIFFSAYLRESDYPKTATDKYIFLDENDLNIKNKFHDFIAQNQIEIIVVQQCGNRFIKSLIKEICVKQRIKSIFFQHDKVIDNTKSLRLSFKYAIFSDISVKNRIYSLLKYYFFHIYNSLLKYRLKNIYRRIYNDFDRIVVLTERYIPELMAIIGHGDECDKIRVINNCVTLQPQKISKLKDRKKKVLIVSRMTEERKRILLAIKIWHKLQNTYEELKDWSLQLVGSGEYLKLYKRYALKHRVKNIFFVGQVDDVEKYYREAQIFMMTSYSEGWGLTLTEAQQYGVVPIAFNSYEAINDIIENNVNGILIKEGDIEGYVNQLAHLMLSDDDRYRISVNALDIEQKYPIENTVNQFELLFNECLK